MDFDLNRFVKYEKNPTMTNPHFWRHFLSTYRRNVVCMDNILQWTEKYKRATFFFWCTKNVFATKKIIFLANKLIFEQKNFLHFFLHGKISFYFMFYFLKKVFFKNSKMYERGNHTFYFFPVLFKKHINDAQKNLS